MRRIKLNSMRPENQPDWDQAKAYCRQKGVVGVG